MTRSHHDPVRRCRRYPKSIGPACAHAGSDLFYRTLKALLERYDNQRNMDAEKVRNTLRRLPALFDRCRDNAGY